MVYAKRPFGRPEAVLAYLSRYTHRIAIANSRLVAFDGERVTFVRQFHNRGNGAMATGKFVSYLRVSTDRQGRSGLGFEAQRKAVTDCLDCGRWELIAEFVEVETGKRDDRPKLKRHCTDAR